MIALWIAAALVAGIAFGLIVLLSGRPVLAPADAARGVYRRQLTEVDDLAARGLLGDEERKAAHAEAARRLLGEVDDAPEAAPSKSAGTTALIVAALVATAALAIYLFAGAPSTPDQTYAHRLKSWREADPTTLMAPQVVALLEEKLKQSPNDPTGLFYLAQAQGAANDFASAERSLEKSLAAEPSRADAWDLLGRTRVELAAGKVPRRAQDAFHKALELDPGLMLPRYFLAHAALDEGRTAEGVAALKELKTKSPPEGQVVLDKEIAEAEGRVAPTPDVKADPAIVAMVNGLAARLKDNPDDVAGWQRLIRSYTVLNDKPALDKAMTDARAYFKNRPADLATIEAAGKAPAPAPGQ